MASFNVYQLTITYNTGCIVIASDTVRIEQLAGVAIPTAFSPNNDSKNDTFLILAKGVSSFNMTIYNRWGELVFSSTDVNTGWDGTYKGTPQPSGDYPFFFNIRYENGKTESHSGTLSLFR
jgi:gliding motility-associated-like protein